MTATGWIGSIHRSHMPAKRQNPGLRLVRAADAEAAVSHVVDALRDAGRLHPLSGAWVVLPDADSIRAMRQRLGAVMAVELIQPYRLADKALDASNVQAGRLPDVAARRLVRSVLEELARQGSLSAYGAVATKRGFLTAVLEWLGQTKSRGTEPAEIAALAEKTGDPRDADLARILSGYQSALDSVGLEDAEGLVRLAARTLGADETLLANAPPVFLLGFDQLSPIQLELVHQLGRRVKRLDVVVRNEPRVGLDDLATKASRPDGLQLDPSRLGNLAPTPTRLEVLAETVLGWGAKEVATEVAPDAEVSAAGGTVPDRIRRIAAPDRSTEAREALRLAKRLLAGGARADQIVLLAPSFGPYARAIESVAGEMAVPVAVPQPLGANPAVGAALAALQLYPEFPWRSTFDVLRNPYLDHGLELDDLSLLARLTRERPVVEGRGQWRHALAPVRLQDDATSEDAPVDADADEDLADEDLADPPLAAQLPEETLAALLQQLEGVFDTLTPPERATYRDYASWFETRVIGVEEGTPTLGIAGRATAGAFAERDAEALNELLRALERLVEAAELVPGKSGNTAGGEPVPWEVFRDDLAGLGRRQIPSILGIRVGDIEAGRAMPADHILIMGLAEGELPRRPPPDVLFAAEEREQRSLPVDNAADQASAFWQVVTNARHSLTVTRPRSDANGAEWPPSALWEALDTALPNLPPVVSPATGRLPALEDTASPDELLVVLASGSAGAKADILASNLETSTRTRPGPEPSRGPLRSPGRQTVEDGWTHALSETLAHTWKAARHGDAVQQAREDWDAPGIYEGVLHAPDVVDRLRRLRSGPDARWSVSRLNRYGQCPLGYFAEVVLGVAAEEEPGAGLSARQWGSLVHRVLEVLYRALTADGLAPRDLEDAALAERVAGACQVALADAPARYGFRPGPLWRHEQIELARSVASLVRWEQSDWRFRGWVPHRQEQRFGLPGGLPGLTLHDADGEAFGVHGIIDRLDVNADGGLKVIDYKTGSRRYTARDIENGLALQSTLYAVAAERLTRQPVVESVYVHVPIRETSGEVRVQADSSTRGPSGQAARSSVGNGFPGHASEKSVGPESRVEAEPRVQAALLQAGRAVARTRSGVFPPAPGKPAMGGTACSYQCPFRAVCRITRRSIWKARHAGWD